LTQHPLHSPVHHVIKPESYIIILGRSWASSKLHLKYPHVHANPRAMLGLALPENILRYSYLSSQTTMAMWAWAKFHNQTMS